MLRGVLGMGQPYMSLLGELVEELALMVPEGVSQLFLEGCEALVAQDEEQGVSLELVPAFAEVWLLVPQALAALAVAEAYGPPSQAAEGVVVAV